MNIFDFKKLSMFIDLLVGAGLPVKSIAFGCFTFIFFDARHMDAGECYELLWAVLDRIDFDVTISNTDRNFPYLIISDYGAKNRSV